MLICYISKCHIDRLKVMFTRGAWFSLWEKTRNERLKNNTLLCRHICNFSRNFNCESDISFEQSHLDLHCLQYLHHGRRQLPQKGGSKYVLAFATSVDPDQPAHPRSLIRVYTVAIYSNWIDWWMKMGVRSHPSNPLWRRPWKRPHPVLKLIEDLSHLESEISGQEVKLRTKQS